MSSWAETFARAESLEGNLSIQNGFDPDSEIPDDARASKQLAQILQRSLVSESLDESKGPKIKTLKDNRVELDPAERRKVMSAGAVWHKGNDGKPSPAVWKAVVNGKTWYVCNTHRAFQCKKSLGAAIRAFKFIKTTA